jgi:hypothetical protein
MTRRPLLVFGLLAGLLALGVGGWVFWSRDTTCIEEDSFVRLRVGMTETEVVRIIGVPAGDYRTDPTGHPAGPLGPTGAFGDGKGIDRKHWYSDTYWIQVVFDERGKVAGGFIGVTPGAMPTESLSAKVRRWLHL